MLKTIRSSAKLASRVFRATNNKVVRGGGDKADETIVNSSKSKNEKFGKLTFMPNIETTKKPNFLTVNTKKAFIYLRLAFIKVLIL